MNAAIFRRAARATLLATLMAGAPLAAAVAQQSNASVAAYGLAGNYMALAKGYDAVAWNPAMLGLPGNPGFSLSLMSLSGTGGFNPINLSDVKTYQNQFLSTSVKQAWLARVTASGGENGAGNAGITYLAMSAGLLAFQVSSTGYLSATMTPDAFQALMFGNAGLTGSPQTLNFGGSNVAGEAFTTGAVSLAIPLARNDRQGTSVSLGITGKYIMGNGLVRAQDGGSSITANNVQVLFPIVYSPDSNGVSAGTGMGVDVGAAWRSQGTTWSLAVQNVMNTFKWDQTKLASRAGTASFNGTTNSSNFDSVYTFARAPQSMQQAILNDVFKPVAAFGMATQLSRKVTFTADVRERIGDGISLEPRSQAGAGLELRWIPILPIRLGGSYISGGYAGAAGISLALGPYELGVAGQLRHTDQGSQNGIMIGLVSFK